MKLLLLKIKVFFKTQSISNQADSATSSRRIGVYEICYFHPSKIQKIQFY